jgi:hypothetical protein
MMTTMWRAQHEHSQESVCDFGRSLGVSDAAIEHIAENRNFPSREAPRSANKRVPRRYRTGRDQHVGIKTTAETRTRLYKAADERKVPLGVVLELALDALERAGGSNN